MTLVSTEQVLRIKTPTFRDYGRYRLQTLLVLLPGNHWNRDVPRTSRPLRHSLRGQSAHEDHVQARKSLHEGGQASALLLRGSTDVFITKKQGGFQLAAFSDANWANNPDNCRFTSLYIVLLANAPISFKVALQGPTAQSTIEAKLLAAALAIKEAVFCSNIMVELGFDENFGSVPQNMDNASAATTSTVLAQSSSP